MIREEALELMKAKLNNKNLQKHTLATEACMRFLAEHFGENEELWGITGLLHDVDYEETAKDADKHGLISAKLLDEMGVDERIVYSVKAHAGHVKTVSRMDKALFAVDPLTGLIVAATLMHPTKKIADVDTQFVLNRFKEKSFAKGANRENIQTCEEIDLSLDEFIAICIKAMQSISDELGL